MQITMSFFLVENEKTAYSSNYLNEVPFQLRFGTLESFFCVRKFISVRKLTI